MSERLIRLWPAWVLVALQAIALALTVTPSIQNTRRFVAMMLGPLICFVLFLLWLSLASRLPWKERLAILLGMLGVGGLGAFLAHPSMRVAVWIYGIPLAMLAVTLALAVAREASSRRRLLYAVGGVALCFGLLDLARLHGFTGSYWPELGWRWSATTEERLVAATGDDSKGVWDDAQVAWPGFRGAHRDSRASGPLSPLDWRSGPPRELWRIPVGPAWSSFAHASGRLFTQEQRGDEELVSCYDADTGATLWQASYPARFSEVVSGAGPRATPTLAAGRVFALGGTAILSALDAATGELLWRHDLMEEFEAPMPVWGFSASPLVHGERVIVYAGGTEGAGILAFDVASGELVWQVASQGMNFASAQAVRLADHDLVLFTDSTGLLALKPTDGEVVWRFTPTDWGTPMVQPQQIGPRDLVVALGDGGGVARLEVRRDGDAWSVREVWSSRGLKPSFNDFVFHDGFLYGFDQNIFSCLDAETGERRWKRGRYGFGQVVLLKDSSQLILAAENGDVVLLAADPKGHVELGRHAVLDGKTWNHPIVADGRLWVRNGREAVALDLVGTS